MPHGELFFRRRILRNGVPHDDDQGVDNGWYDAFDEWGISFTDASLSRLVTPAPAKEAIENKSRLQHGKRVVRSPRYARKDERTVSLEMHLSAPSKAEFWRRYITFCEHCLDAGFFDIKHRDFTYSSEDGEDKPFIFRMTYVSCEEFSEFVQQLAKFTLTLSEPDPTNRYEEDAWAEET